MYFWHNVLECYDLLLKDETFMEYYVVINVIFYLFIKSQITILFFFSSIGVLHFLLFL